jgi:predicted RNA-binding Zn-ribbon protein involved in translation (DUF1610 family)
MGVKSYRILGIVLGLSSLLLFVLTYLYSNLLYFIIGILVLVGSIFLIVFSMVVDLYQKDKNIDYEIVKKMNLTIVTCKVCGKENILEDQYCRYCNEQLEAEQ